MCLLHLSICEIDPVIYHSYKYILTFSPFFGELPLRVITRDMHCLPPHPPQPPLPQTATTYHPPLRLALGLDRAIYNSSFIWHSQSFSLFHTAVAHFTGKSCLLPHALVQISQGT